MRKISKTHILIILFVLAISSMLTSPRQSHAQQTGSWVSEVSQGGFILKKVVSDTLIASGQPFSYNVYYTMPVGASNVTITDNIPTALEFLGHSVNNACDTPTVNAPTINNNFAFYKDIYQSTPPHAPKCFGIYNKMGIMVCLHKKISSFISSSF